MILIAGFIDMLIHTVMKQIVPVAPPRIRRTDPYREAEGSGGIGMPRLVEIVAEP